MKAAVCTKSGPPDVIKIKDVEKPVPGDNDILIRVIASTVTRGDVFLRKIPRIIIIPVGIIIGFKAMKIPGVEFAGEVVDLGKDVTRFKKGDQVYGTTTGLKYGGNAEYLCRSEISKKGVVAKKPEGISYSEAAAVPVGGMTALHILRKRKIKTGEKILIYGASGSVGTYAVQLAKYFGAEVTGVTGTGNLELVRALGADKVVDYTKEDFKKSGQVYDVVFDAVGKISKSGCKEILKKNGSYLSVKYPTKENEEYLIFLKELIEAGKIKPVIDRYYTLDQISEAHNYVEKGHKKGNVVINILG